MDKGLFFMTLSLACIWIILDDFFGKKYISTLISNLIPSDFGKITLPSIPLDDPVQKEKSRKSAKDAIDKDPAKTDAQKKKEKELVDHFYGPQSA